MTVGSISPFRPSGTVSVAAGATSVATQLSGGGETVVVTNTAPSLAYVRFGSDLTVIATTSDMPVLAGSRAVLCVNSLVATVGVILSSGSGTVLFTRGDGSFL